ncbi:hypothetical protein AB833_11500 [Chromatiales bacterium (ex Bugula neritina AB1)]|nr:hypothetical protein AB833_11500 [Chromatiales bacterium (ex Bugula neritina AB1)]
MSEHTTLLQSNEFGRVAVLMGGWSAEREVSLNSGAQVLAALCDSGIDAFAVDVDRSELTNALSGKCDRVFNVLHGTWGEDGKIQGLLETLNIPYTGSGVLASAVTMDKHLSKTLCRQHGIPTPDWSLVKSMDECVAAAREIGFPTVVKPACEGSSIGVSIVQNNEVGEAYRLAANYGDVIVEQFVAGAEITAAILKDQVMPLVKISTPRQFYDYDAKYLENSTQYECPCGLSSDLEEKIQNLALEAFKRLQCSGWGRVDFLLDNENNPYFLEANTAPGMTTHSLVPVAARSIGLSFPELVMQILSTTVEELR